MSRWRLKVDFDDDVVGAAELESIVLNAFGERGSMPAAWLLTKFPIVPSDGSEEATTPPAASSRVDE